MKLAASTSLLLLLASGCSGTRSPGGPPIYTWAADDLEMRISSLSGTEDPYIHLSGNLRYPFALDDRAGVAYVADVKSHTIHRQKVNVGNYSYSATADGKVSETSSISSEAAPWRVYVAVNGPYVAAVHEDGIHLSVFDSAKAKTAESDRGEVGHFHLTGIVSTQDHIYATYDIYPYAPWEFPKTALWPICSTSGSPVSFSGQPTIVEGMIVGSDCRGDRLLFRDGGHLLRRSNFKWVDMATGKSERLRLPADSYACVDCGKGEEK